VSYHDTQTPGIYGAGVRKAAELHIRNHLALENVSFSGWVVREGTAFVWSHADLMAVLEVLFEEGKNLELTLVSAAELAALGITTACGAMGERSVTTAYAVTVV